MKKFAGMIMVTFILILSMVNAGSARLSGGANAMQVDVLVSSTTPNTSDYIDLTEGEYFGVWYVSSSTVGSPDITLQVLMSYDTTSENFVIPEGMADNITNLTDEIPHVESLSLPPMRYLKIRATGNAATSTDTVVSVQLFIQNNKAR